MSHRRDADQGLLGPTISLTISKFAHSTLSTMLEKSRLEAMHKFDGIPVPATATPLLPPQNRRRRLVNLILYLFLSYIAYKGIQGLVRRSFVQEDLQNGPFGKPLVGKEAEKYFL